MPKRPDLRDIATHIGSALEDMDADTLRSILTYVFKEYVVEGPPPILLHQVETLADLEGHSFAELVTALQTRLDHPELALFQVEGDSVSVRAGGVKTSLVVSKASAGNETVVQKTVETNTPAAESAAPKAVAAKAPAAPAPRTPGVSVVETTFTRPTPGPSERSSVNEALNRGRGELAGVGPGDLAGAPARRPTGISLRGRPQSASSAPQSRTTPAPATSRSSSPEKKEEEPKPPKRQPDEDAASVRFSLLELD